jgi:pimeloyl-ACP methyl ester carboxylesterase
VASATFASRPGSERFDVPWGPGPFPAVLARGSSDRVLVVQQGFVVPRSAAQTTGLGDPLAGAWSVVTFERPGPVEDWSSVIAAVLDAVQARADLPRVALLGLDDGAALALHAAARDPRVSAVVCDPGVVRPLDCALASLPRELVTSWREQDDDASRFQRLVVAASHDREVAATVAALIEPWPDLGLHEVLTRLDGWDVGPVLDDVSVPVLVCDPSRDRALAGQSGELAGLLGDRATLLEAPPGPDRRRAIHDWLDEVVPPAVESGSSR